METSGADIFNIWIHPHLLWSDSACMYLLWSHFATIAEALFTFGLTDYSLSIAFALFAFGVIDCCVRQGFKKPVEGVGGRVLCSFSALFFSSFRSEQ